MTTDPSSAPVPDPSPIPPVPGAVPAAIPEAFRPKPVALLAAAGAGIRLAILRELAAGPALPVKEITRRLGRRRDLISKHLRILLDARAVMVRKSDPADGRKQLYEVPEPFRAAPGVLDYGSVVLRFP